MDTYDGYRINNDGVIVSPGKFEGCYKTVPELWYEGCEGGADDDFGRGFGFIVAARDDSGVSPCILTEDDNGFVYAEYFDTVEEYRAAIECYEQEEEEDAPDTEQDEELATPWKREV